MFAALKQALSLAPGSRHTFSSCSLYPALLIKAAILLGAMHEHEAAAEALERDLSEAMPRREAFEDEGKLTLTWGYLLK
jgi:hypothetical protein